MERGLPIGGFHQLTRTQQVQEMGRVRHQNWQSAPKKYRKKNQQAAMRRMIKRKQEQERARNG